MNKNNNADNKNWFEHLFSISELKFSSLVLGMFVSLGFGIFFCFENGDIPANLYIVILTFIGGITGVSAYDIYNNRLSVNGNVTNPPISEPVLPSPNNSYEPVPENINDRLFLSNPNEIEEPVSRNI